jgi:hypothetical protein
MSILEQIRQLDEQRAKLLGQAKAEALTKAEEAIHSLSDLGFNYRLVEANAPVATSTGTRRTGIRQDVLRVVTEHGEGISRSDILELMGAKGDKKGEQSISNALSNLKSDEKVTLEDGLYKVAGA